MDSLGSWFPHSNLLTTCDCIYNAELLVIKNGSEVTEWLPFPCPISRGSCKGQSHTTADHSHYGLGFLPKHGSLAFEGEGVCVLRKEEDSGGTEEVQPTVKLLFPGDRVKTFIHA